AGAQRLMVRATGQPSTYILASRRNGKLYVGVTSDIIARVWQHKCDLVAGFSKRYQTHLLVWFEIHAVIECAIAREKAIKEWKRAWKISMIETANPYWRDLYEELL
ncbi:MAG: GIY-YIG nuclease family protein, partial [Rhodanobacteraceae bacterium]